MAVDGRASMTWDAGRKVDFAGFTYTPPSTPLNPQADLTGQLPKQDELRDDGLHWHFGFPGALLTAPLRFYMWGLFTLHAWFGRLDGAPVYRGYLTRASTEEFYRGSQTRQALPFTTLSAFNATNSSNRDCLFCGTTEDGTLWAWGRCRDEFANALGVGEPSDFPEAITVSNSGSASSKLIAFQPQPLYGQDDELVNVRFVKVIAAGNTDNTTNPANLYLVALTDDGNLYCCGSGSPVFGDGDYYTNRTSTGGQNIFSYPKLVKGWGLTFGFENGQFLGTVVERPPKVFVDFSMTRAFFLAVDDTGTIYSNDYATGFRRTRTGSTYNLQVTENGRGYVANPTVTATASPTGDTMTLTAAFSASTPSGSGVLLTVTNWGSGYTTAPTITISAPTGGGTKVTATATVDILPSDNKWKKVFMGGYGAFAINEQEELFFIERTDGFLIGNAFAKLHASAKFVKCAVGAAFLIALDKDGAVWTMGTANNGTASSRSTLQVLDAGPWIDIAAGREHGLMLKADGEAWAWGNNLYGQLGRGNTTNSATPVKVSGNAKWKTIFGGTYCTLAIRDEQLDTLGNKVSPLEFAG